MLQELTDYILKKYPTRSKSGIRTIENKGSHYEIYFNGGETLYLSTKQDYKLN